MHLNIYRKQTTISGKFIYRIGKHRKSKQSTFKRRNYWRRVDIYDVVGWLVGFVALRPKSTAMVIAGRSVHLTTLFPGQA